MVQISLFLIPNNCLWLNPLWPYSQNWLKKIINLSLHKSLIPSIWKYIVIVEFFMQLMLQALNLDRTLVHLSMINVEWGSTCWDACNRKRWKPFPYIRMRRTGTPHVQSVAIADAQTAGMQWCVVMVFHVESSSTLNTLTLLWKKELSGTVKNVNPLLPS